MKSVFNLHMLRMMPLRQICRYLLKKTNSQIHNGQAMHTSGVRCLFSADMLGLENYKRHRSTTQEKIGDLQDMFRNRMNEYMDSAHNTIFTGDLKNMIYSAETNDDLETAKLMIERFRQQRGELRLSNFVFGPLIMRMCHLLNQPDLAYELLMTGTKSDGFYDQMSTFVVLMDLLFENCRYKEVLEVMDVVKERRVAGTKYPADCMVLLAASCCKLNTPEAYQHLLNEIQSSQEAGSNVPLRAIVFTALLALKQSDPNSAMELLGSAKAFKEGRPPVAFVNMKVLTYTHLGREEDAILELRCLLNNDGPDSKVYDVFPDVINALTEAVEKRKDPEMIHKITELRRGLEENRHIHTQLFDDYVFSPIIRKRQQQDSYKARARTGAMGYNRNRPARGLRDREDHVNI